MNMTPILLEPVNVQVTCQTPSLYQIWHVSQHEPRHHAFRPATVSNKLFFLPDHHYEQYQCDHVQVCFCLKNSVNIIGQNHYVTFLFRLSTHVFGGTTLIKWENQKIRPFPRRRKRKKQEPIQGISTSNQWIRHQFVTVGQG